MAPFFRALIKRILQITRGATPRRKATANQRAGLWGERIAAKKLGRDGYKIVGRRVRPNRRDEIDIIVRKGNLLAFVEVKTRKDTAFGRPASAVNQRKRRHLIRAARAYLRKANYPKMVYRFDIVEVIGSKESPEKLIVRHVQNAFQFPSR